MKNDKRWSTMWIDKLSEISDQWIVADTLDKSCGYVPYIKKYAKKSVKLYCDGNRTKLCLNVKSIAKLPMSLLENVRYERARHEYIISGADDDFVFECCKQIINNDNTVVNDKFSAKTAIWIAKQLLKDNFNADDELVIWTAKIFSYESVKKKLLNESFDSYPVELDSSLDYNFYYDGKAYTISDLIYSS